MAACATADDPEACRAEAEVQFEQCLRSCRRPDHPPVPCDVRCEDVAMRARERCDAAGHSVEECDEIAARILEACLAGCDDQPDDPPPCEDRCAEAEEHARMLCERRGLSGEACDAFVETVIARCAEHCERRLLHSDFDLDGDVDLADTLAMQACFSGAGRSMHPDCFEADTDGDGDVDLADFLVHQSEFGRSER